MRRLSRSVAFFLGTALACAAVAPGALAAGATSVTRPAPKVVLIVGPAGSATASYRRLADEAAAAASAFTPNVVRAYSPDATWPVVKDALQGASIVIYLGHGNGWPSRYTSALTPSTQNGMGLNPNVGAGDVHQYFGEDRIGTDVRLAKNAVVIFSHLCYASGNSEPGLPEGSLDTAQQRVDNYASGFIRAGASAVIAEAYMGPAYYVRSVLAGNGTIDRIWRDAPTANGNFLRFNSIRSPGFVAQMDPDNALSGFHRSIVLRGAVAASNVIAGGARTPGGVLVAPSEPSLVGRGIEFASPDLTTPPTAGSSTRLTFSVLAADPVALPAHVMVGVRWDGLDGALALTPGANAAPAPSPSPSPSSSPPASTPPSLPDVPVDLVSPEVLGEVVTPVAAQRTRSGLSVPVRVPATPGLYRLVATIHGPDGLAYDAATQALVPALVVRVVGPLTARYDAPASADMTAGGTLDLLVRVTNLGAAPWGAPAISNRIGDAETIPAERATLVARWVSLSAAADGSAARDSSAVLPPGLQPAASSRLTLSLRAPTAPGDYLMILDVVTPRSGSLAAAGAPPGIVRISVSSGASTIAP